MVVVAPARFDDQLRAVLVDAARFKPDILRAARRDPVVFAAYVLRDESTRAPIRMAPAHVEWQRQITNHLLTAFIAPVESGKTQQVGLARTLFVLGRNPQARCLVIGKSYEQATKNVKAIRSYIEESNELHEVFPHLRRGRGGTWTDGELVVERRGILRDPSVRAVGINSEFQGARLEWVVGDDLVTWANTITQKMRDSTWNWFAHSVYGRMVPGARCCLISNAQHADDLLHRMNKPGGAWLFKRYPVVDDGGVLLWPERWPLLRIEEARRRMGPEVFEKQLMCRVRDDDSAEFDKRWIGTMLQMGDTWEPTPYISPSDLEAGAMVYTGVDLADSQGDGSDLYAMVTVVQLANGNLFIANVEAGHWTPQDVVKRLGAAHQRYGGLLVIERNAQQNFLGLVSDQLARVPMRYWNTTAETKYWALESLKADMANGRLLCPNKAGEMAPEIEALVNEVRLYRRQEHTGDRLMALVIACAAARQERQSNLAYAGEAEVILLDNEDAPRISRNPFAWPEETKLPDDDASDPEKPPPAPKNPFQ